ncbi:alpha,alpha-trehalose-phosphate synthase (UDP-forming) [Algicella marina]|uniref:Trehalose-6-phosphate synthase n=1 Tax=Algicella marina TaxID=2683284 RepID=A0A6P1SUL8_9RHOB|nr:trehalose-6-phosphate synthase [Algicella marina]QHQ34138.1 trehalose-6-phosphate synthase [Algicella marina]
MSRLIVLSNRLPLGDAPSGGLVVALEDALASSGGLWIGHHGIAEDPCTRLTSHDGASFDRATFTLTESEHEGYYLGYANSVLWPICHGRADLSQIEHGDLETYRAVNARVAGLVAEILQPDDILWVQDYHFFPIATELRARGVRNRIGFFLHIPFPSPQDLQALPNAEEVLSWLADFSLIGFQANRDVFNLRDCIRHITELDEAMEGVIEFGGKSLNAAAFPIGIDAKAFAEEAKAARKSDRVRTLTGADLMIGVDRLDYSKGLPQRFRAFQQLLETHEDLHEQIAFLQIAPPTREEVQAYQDIREETEHLAGRINGRFATLNWTPIRYIHRAVPREILAGLFRQARIGLVTPLNDGMNLVAKEYVAAQRRNNPGVLILSRFAGAAEQMDAALLINPHDPYETAEAIATAFRMPLEERQDRHEALLREVTEKDVRWWSDAFLKQLAAA